MNADRIRQRTSLRLGAHEPESTEAVEVARGRKARGPGARQYCDRAVRRVRKRKARIVGEAPRKLRQVHIHGRFADAVNMGRGQPIQATFQIGVAVAVRVTVAVGEITGRRVRVKPR